MNRADSMHKLLEHLLDLPENKDGLGAQIVTAARASTVVAGAIKRSPVKGIYVIRNVAELNETKQKIMLDVFFAPDDLLQLHIMTKQDEPLVKPIGNGSIIAP